MVLILKPNILSKLKFWVLQDSSKVLGNIRSAGFGV